MTSNDELQTELYEIAFWHLDEYICPSFMRGYNTWLSERPHLVRDSVSRALYVRYYMFKRLEERKLADQLNLSFTSSERLR